VTGVWCDFELTLENRTVVGGFFSLSLENRTVVGSFFSLSLENRQKKEL
jgi:hypothetical protein